MAMAPQKCKLVWVILRDGKIWGSRMTKNYAEELMIYFAARPGARKHKFTLVRGSIVVPRSLSK